MTTPDHPTGVAAPTLVELKRAWQAVLDGRYRDGADWCPAGQVVAVAGCTGGAGASVVALAIAEAAGEATLIDCADPVRSGLTTAGRTELGDQDGWTRSTRDAVMILRAAIPGNLPMQTAGLAVVDLGWDLDAALQAGGWSAGILRRGPSVLVAPATVPGLRRVETALAALAGTPSVVAVRGERRRLSELRGFRGPLTRDATEQGRLVTIPHDRRVALHGIEGTPLPEPLLWAARRLLDVLNLPAVSTQPRKVLL